MGILEELGIDAIGQVDLPQGGWHSAALKMVEDRRKQVTRAKVRAKTERQEQALLVELKRLADLEEYVRVCKGLPPYAVRYTNSQSLRRNKPQSCSATQKPSQWRQH
jgi:hypothetical protein